VYLNPRPDAEERRELYKEEYFASHLSRQYPSSAEAIAEGIASAGDILDLIRPWKAGGRILEIGTATGFLLAAAREEGWEPWGVEISAYASQYAREQLGLNVQTGELEDVSLPAGYFDVAVMWHLVEHFSDPLRSLRQVHSLLNAEGLLVIRTPDISSLEARWHRDKWEGLRIPYHTCLFTPRTLEKALGKTGFRVIKFDFWISPLALKPFLPLLNKTGLVKKARPSHERRQARTPAPAGQPLIERLRRIAKKHLKPRLARTFRGRSLTAFVAKATRATD
jgi:SAM-dependent methyltransferase